MNIQELKKRLDQKRPVKSVRLQMPEDVIEDLKKVALQLGFSSYEALAKVYIGQGLRSDITRLESLEISGFIESLRKRGVNDEIISSALSDTKKAA